MAKRNKFCVIKDCEHSKGFRSVDIHFYRMPLQGEQRQKWLEIIKCQQDFPNEMFDVLTYVYVCSEHFETRDILNNGKLRKLAVPSIFRWKKMCFLIYNCFLNMYIFHYVFYECNFFFLF